MAAKPRLVTLDAGNYDRFPCCGVKNAAHPGRREKGCWLEANAQFGLCAKTLVTPDGEACGYLEWAPGEFAWRGVDAPGYLVIHCQWIYARRHQGKGWGSLLIEDAIAEARAAGMRGVAVVTRDGPWMADRRLYLAHGFTAVGSAPPDYQLLTRKFDSGAANPSFRTGWEQKLARYGDGLTILRSSQCPHIAKFAADIAQIAAQEYGLTPQTVELASWSEAQDAPTPYAVFAVIHKGRLLADHPISGTRFRNILRKLGVRPRDTRI